MNRGDKLHIQFERVPKTDRATDWAEFTERINALAGQGYRLTKATDDYVVLEESSMRARKL